MIIDAKNVVLGRLSSFAAKQLLLGEEVDNIYAAYIAEDDKE